MGYGFVKAAGDDCAFFYVEPFEVAFPAFEGFAVEEGLDRFVTWRFGGYGLAGYEGRGREHDDSACLLGNGYPSHVWSLLGAALATIGFVGGVCQRRSFCDCDARGIPAGRERGRRVQGLGFRATIHVFVLLERSVLS